MLNATLNTIKATVFGLRLIVTITLIEFKIVIERILDIKLRLYISQTRLPYSSFRKDS